MFSWCVRGRRSQRQHCDRHQAAYQAFVAAGIPARFECFDFGPKTLNQTVLNHVCALML